METKKEQINLLLKNVFNRIDSAKDFLYLQSAEIYQQSIQYFRIKYAILTFISFLLFIIFTKQTRFYLKKHKSSEKLFESDDLSLFLFYGVMSGLFFTIGIAYLIYFIQWIIAPNLAMIEYLLEVINSK